MNGEPMTLFGLEINSYRFLILLAFACLVIGYWLAVRMNRRHRAPDDATATDRDRNTSNIAFMRGINYILADQPDQAIEELTRAVSVDTETVETYVALGNLFRGKGEIDRAIRIRQSIILRPNLDERLRLQARYDLGQDYRQGGFFERAVRTFKEILDEHPDHEEARRRLIELYEETRDWENAFEEGRNLARITGIQLFNVLAHYQVEMGKIHAGQGRTGQAKTAYKKALSLDDGCIDAHLHLGDLLHGEGRHRKALAEWRRVIDIAPQWSNLVFSRLASVSVRLDNLKPVEDFLREASAAGPNPRAHLALARLLTQQGDTHSAVAELRRALDLNPNLLELHRELGRLLLTLDDKQDALEAYRNLLDHLPEPETVFHCGRCGFESRRLMWHCPQCLAWDSMIADRRMQHPHVRPSSEEISTAGGTSPASDTLGLPD
jgi:lipopolysaccharide assembly protein B